MPATDVARPAHSHTEIEAKLRVDPLFAMPDLRDLPGVAGVVAMPDAVLHATYFDTPDLTLLAAGITLRHRREPEAPAGSPGTWTLKLPGQAGGLALQRSELTWEEPAGAIPAEAISLTRARVRRAVLGPVAELQTRRQRFALMGADGLPAAELDDDVVTVHGGPGDGRVFREIEVEITDSSTTRTLEAAVERLQAAGASAEQSGTKLGRALGAPPAGRRANSPVRLGPRSTVGEAVRMCLGDGLRTLIAHDIGIRLGGDVEHVHQARVAARRLRSELRLFRPELEPDWERRLSDGLKRLGQALGAVRDTDVMVAGLQDALAELELADGAAAGSLLNRLVRERTAAVARLRAEMDGEAYLDLLDALSSAALAPELVRDEGAEVHDVLPALMRRQWKRMRAQAGSLPEVPRDEALHELRKRAKHLRYAAERAAPALRGTTAKRAAKLGRRAEDLQDVLGRLHDAGVREEWLRAQKRLKEGASLAAGELIAAAVEERQRAREVWQEPWDDARKAWRKFTKASSG
ncbi:MAG TPA: CYTH and CHAD domain-containing protein [Actinomycetota bacterium]|nr:CYTH and CHAD domain-containing protein [Actinomycetota bacterium]